MVGRALYCNFMIKNKAGLSLVELVISLTVLAVLLILTIPSFKDLLMNDRVAALKSEFNNALNYARNSALSRNVTVAVCPFSAVGSAACGGNWQAGFIVVSDPGGTSTLLLSRQTGPNDPVISSSPVNGVSATSVIFDTRGLATTEANFKVCDSRGAAFARSLEVLPTGLVQSGSTVGRAAWDGSALACP